jgi:hypothetical protein
VSVLHGEEWCIHVVGLRLVHAPDAARGRDPGILGSINPNPATRRPLARSDAERSCWPEPATSLPTAPGAVGAFAVPPAQAAPATPGRRPGENGGPAASAQCPTRAARG